MYGVSNPGWTPQRPWGEDGLAISGAAATLERARRVPPDRLNESVGGDWTLLETIRHLVFATERWITGPALSDVEPFHPLGMPTPPIDEVPPGILEFDACPSLDEARSGAAARVALRGAFWAFSMNFRIRRIDRDLGSHQYERCQQ